MKKPALIADWRKAWRFLTIQATAVLTVLSAIQADMLPYIQPIFPAQYWPYVTAAFGITIVGLRILRQASLDETPPSAGDEP
ncbi:hypothetical protein SAMN05216303_102310 [Rhodoferax sp. OV413]|uniref:DUF7940 domain-containing protein n=1 Tax=Rhodoferax sp. OV413 TaxID=1855285 RepID=UPI00088FD1BD|nr:hypothetical protein [Rhodoferax sp. OV413]SDO77020.1 hypothetical protein SAMN05216303_102310 [Rhodoferax sp. OV413]